MQIQGADLLARPFGPFALRLLFSNRHFGPSRAPALEIPLPARPRGLTCCAGSFVPEGRSFVSSVRLTSVVKIAQFKR
jgi:hypothetical protein